MIIYLDIVLVENLCMNYIILFATGFIMKIKMKHLRMILAGIIGGVYAILAYTQILPYGTTIPLKIILSIVMVYISFSPQTIKILIKQLIIFYLVSFVFGGCVLALLYFIKPSDVFINNGVYTGTYPIKIAILGGIIGFIIMKIASKILKNRLDKKGIIYDIEILLNNKSVKLKAMLDTGNMLKEPITQIPVVLVEKDKLYGIIPKEILNNIDKIIEGKWKEDIDWINFKERLKIIPFESIGKQNGILLGFKVDNIKIINDTNEISNEKVIIGIYNYSLSSISAYSALMGLDMLEGRKENESITNIKI